MWITFEEGLESCRSLSHALFTMRAGESDPKELRIPAVVMAGDQRGARSIGQESKVFLELDGRPLIVHILETLQRVPEISEIWVVGDQQNLSKLLDSPPKSWSKAVTVVPQLNNLYQNAWETFRRSLPGAGPEGRDPTEKEVLIPYLYVSGDLPFATPQEVSAFITLSLESDGDYVLGLAPQGSLASFSTGEPKYVVAYFNLAEGRFRQTNLHLVRPAKIRNRELIGEMYDYRYQRKVKNVLPLAWQMLYRKGGRLAALWYYILIHVAGWVDRRGLSRIADIVRRYVPLAKVAGCVSSFLGAKFQFVITEAGGCAVDIDSEEQYLAAKARYSEWRKSQEETAVVLYGTSTSSSEE